MVNFQSVLSFNGKDNHVEIAYTKTIKPSRFTISCWARVQGKTGESRCVLCFFDENPSTIYSFYTANNNQWHFWMGTAANSIGIAGSNINLNAWTHLAATYDGAKLKLYINGNLVAQKDATYSPHTIRGVRIGSHHVSGEFFQGEITEVCICNRVRDLEEIQRDMYRSLLGDEPDVVGYWPLSEGTGTTVADKSDKGNNGTIKGATWQQQILIPSPNKNNYFSSVLRFDGVDDYIAFPAMNIDYSRGITIEAWVRYNSFKNQSRILDFGNGAGGSNFVLWNVSTTNGLRFDIFRGRQLFIQTGGTLETGKWLHISLTIDAAGKAKLYINAQLIRTGDLAAPESVNRVNNYIAKSNWGGDGFFDGQIAEVRLWNRDRSALEIQENMYRYLTGSEANLVGYWPLNEGAGNTTVIDRSVNGNHGTIYGATWQQQIFIQPIEIKPAEVKPPESPAELPILSFDGKDDCIAFGKKPQFKIEKNITIEAWVYPQESNRQWTGIISNIFDTGATESGYGLVLDGQTGVYFGLTPSATNRIVYLSSGANSLKLNEWHHVAATYDGQQMKVYINGVQKAIQAVASPNISYNPENDLHIGAYKDNDENYYFQGKIAEVRLWNIARTPEDIKKDSSRRLVGNEAGLVGYWPLNEGANNTINDKTSNGNHGTIQGASWQLEKALPLVVPKTNAVLSFDGIDDWVEFPGKSFPTGNELTVSFWSYGGNALPKQCSAIASVDKAGTRVFNIHLPWDNGVIYFDTVYGGSFDRIEKQAQPAEYKGKWVHWAFTKNAITGEMKIYLNGELWHSGTGKKATIPPSEKFTLGAHINGYYHHGVIQELVIWSRALSQEEIKQNMSSRLSITGNEVGLYAYWPLNEGSGATVFDKTNKENHGTIKGATWQIQESILQPAKPPTSLPNYTQSLLAFNGKDSFVNLGQKPAFKVENKITLEAWVFVEKEGAWTGIVSNLFYTGSSLSGYGLCLDDQSSAAFCLLPHDLNSEADSLKPFWWHHVAGTYDGKKLRIYINGVEKASKNASSFTIKYTPENDLLIGAYRDDNELSSLKGRVVEVRLWNRDRTPEEINQNIYSRLTGNEEELVGYWPLNEGFGATTKDKTSNSNLGAITNAIWEQQLFLQPSLQQLPFQSVLTFDGKDDVVETKPHLNPTNAITVSVWAKSNTPQWNQYGCLASKREAYVLHPMAGSKEIIFYIFSGGWKPVAYTPSNIDLTKWHHYAGTFDGKNLRLYIDGGEVATQPCVGTINPDSGALSIGQDDGLAGRFFGGQIAEVRIWNRALSKEEIPREMNARLVGNELGLVGYWPLNEGAGNVVTDKSTAANHGQIKGDAVWQRQIFPLGATARLTGNEEQISAEEKAKAEQAAAEAKAQEDAKIAAEKLALEKAIVEKTAAENAAAEAKAALEKIQAEKAAAEKLAADNKAALDKALADKAASEKLAADNQAALDKALADKAASEKLAADNQAALDKALADKAASEKLANDNKAALDQALADKAASEKLANDNQAALDKALADKAASEKLANDNQAALDKALADKEASEKFATDNQAALEQALADKAAADNQVALEQAELEQALADKAAAEKALEEAQAMAKNTAATKNAKKQNAAALAKILTNKEKAEKLAAEKMTTLEKALADKEAAEKTLEEAQATANNTFTTDSAETDNGDALAKALADKEKAEKLVAEKVAELDRLQKILAAFSGFCGKM
mgnify:FL=1